VSKPAAADVLVARSADRISLITMRGDAAAALELVRELHEHRSDVRVALRCDNNPVAVERKRTPMAAKWGGRCTACATAIHAGEPIYYDSESRRAVHARCA
jgi:hypothetical protein